MRKMTMFENEDYILRDELTGPDETTAIEIASDTVWKGVIYRYTAVSFVEDPVTGKANMRFGFNIIDPVGFTEGELQADAGFTNYIGTILNSLILEYVSLPEEEEVVEDEP
jgi:hypothetical protein